MAFLGIDQSLNATGLCRIDGDVAACNLRTVVPGGRRDGERLAHIRRIVDGSLHAVTAAALEGYAYDAVGRVFELGEVGGVIKALLSERAIPYVVVPPVLVKKFATGFAGAPKEMMVRAAVAAGATPADDNQADAFFLARIARAWHLGDAVVRREVEVIRTLRRDPGERKKPRRALRRLVKAAV
jgi:crossover junction endodeoxyribonuclease RuvC